MKTMGREGFLENLLIYTGVALMVASGAFFGLMQMLIAARVSWLPAEQIMQMRVLGDLVMLFLFVLGAGIGLAGGAYTAMNVWRKWRELPAPMESQSSGDSSK